MGVRRDGVDVSLGEKSAMVVGGIDALDWKHQNNQSENVSCYTARVSERTQLRIFIIFDSNVDQWQCNF